VSITIIETKNAVVERLPGYKDLDEDRLTAEVFQFHLTCSNASKEVFEEACVRAVRANNSSFKVSPGQVWNQVKNVMAEMRTGGRIIPRIEADKDARTWCLIEIDRISPEACRDMVRDIEAGRGLTRFANWDSEVLLALQKKAGQAKEEIVAEKPRPFLPAIAEALKVAAPKVETETTEKEVPFE
jgi:hypothetical protein